MRYATVTLALAASAAAFPGMSGARAMMEEMAKAKQENMKRQSENPSPLGTISEAAGEIVDVTVQPVADIVGEAATAVLGDAPLVGKREPAPEPSATGLVGSVLGLVGTELSTLTGDIEGLLGSIAASVDPENLRPQAGYEFQAPGPNDSRGPCPGLNLLANYGYLPRDGYVSYDQVLQATAEGFNMGADLATVLAVFAILADGDIETESWYIGTNPNGEVGGLNRHSTVEADISPNREDFYTGCGDNHHLSSRLFTQNVKFAVQNDKQFNIPAMIQQYDAIADFSKEYNPYLYYFPFPLIVSLGAFAFYPNFFSNGSYGAGGVANYESISSIIGAKYDKDTGYFEYVPEQWPENWYRRSTEYGAVDVLTEIFTEFYPTNIVFPGASTLLTPNFNVSTLLCDLYQGINSITPLLLAGTEAEATAAVSWALNKLDGAFPAGTFIGCPTNAVSPNFPLYGNATQEGGPLDPPPSVAKWVGNNVYNQVYFTAAPTTPACSH